MRLVRERAAGPSMAVDIEVEGTVFGFRVSHPDPRYPRVDTVVSSNLGHGVAILNGEPTPGADLTARLGARHIPEGNGHHVIGWVLVQPGVYVILDEDCWDTNLEKKYQELSSSTSPQGRA